MVSGGIRLEADAKDAKSVDQKEAKEPSSVNQITCDYVFDATGPARAVLESVNKIAQKKVFATESVAENPMKNQFIVYVTMDAKHSRTMRNPLALQSDPLQHTLALEELRSMGWKEFAEPYFNFQILEKNKVCLYCATPPGLPKAKEEAWVKAVLRLKTGNPGIDFQYVKPSRKFKSKPRFIPFAVDPKKVSVAVSGDVAGLPVVIPVGDAQIEPDYRMGIGVESGINRANALLASMQVSAAKKITVDSVEYQKKLIILMAEHEDKIKKYYAYIENDLIEVLETEEVRYKKALTLANDDAQRNLIKASLAEIWFRQSLAKYTDLLNVAKTAIQLDQYHEMKSEMQLDKVIQVLIDVFKTILPSQAQLKAKVDALMLDVANKCRDLAKVYFSVGHHRYSDSEKYFKKALEIYEKYFPQQMKEDIKKIHSNLVMIAYLRGKHEETIVRAESGLAYLADANGADSSDLVNKMSYYLCLALLDHANKNTTSVDVARIHFEKAAKLANWLRGKPKISNADVSKMEEKLKKCSTKLSAPHVTLQGSSVSVGQFFAAPTPAVPEAPPVSAKASLLAGKQPR